MANPEPSYPFRYQVGNHILRQDVPLPDCLECRVNRVRQHTVTSGTSKNPLAVITRLSTNTLKTFLLPTQQLTPDNVSWIVQIHLETSIWPSLASPLPFEAPAVLCIHKDTLVFSPNGKSGWFAASETQHFFSNGRTVELLTFGNLGGDAVQAGPDPVFDYIGTISIHGLHATSVKRKSLSEISKEEYQRLPEEAQRTLGDVKECSCIGFAVVGSNPNIKQTFAPESPSVNVRDLAIPLPASSSPPLQSSANAPEPEPEPISLPSTSKNTGAKGFRKRSFSKYANQSWFPFISSRARRNPEAQEAGGAPYKERPQCPLHSKIGMVAFSNQNVSGTGGDQGQAAEAEAEEPANDGGSASISRQAS
ncbi:hypothetical protein FRC00_008505 [Tulasnella sp. 408]|nr:hypothetical protein FRC00_008505 [Tulasnella sp. 408]